MNGRPKMKKSVLSRLSCLAALATAFVIRAGAMTSSDYVQDGLVVHWDAIDNAGVGMHSSNTTTWVDLSGNGFDWTIDATHGSWTATGLVLDGAAQVGSMPGKTKEDFYGKLKTVEFVFANAEKRDGIIFNAGFKLRAYLYTDKYGRVGFYGAKEYSCGTSVDTGMHAYSVVYGYAGSDADIPSSVSSFKVDNLQKKAETMGDYWSGSGGMSDPVIGGRSGKFGTNAKGTLSTIRIYDRVLTDEERYQNWTRDLARFMGNDSFVSDFAPTTIPRQFLAMERAACEPDFEVRSSATGEVLVKGEDYRVEFANNTSVGTATATVIALKGEYAGRKRVYEFEIFGAYRVTAAAAALDMIKRLVRPAGVAAAALTPARAAWERKVRAMRAVLPLLLSPLLAAVARVVLEKMQQKTGRPANRAARVVLAGSLTSPARKSTTPAAVAVAAITVTK